MIRKPRAFKQFSFIFQSENENCSNEEGFRTMRLLRHMQSVGDIMTSFHQKFSSSTRKNKLLLISNYITALQAPETWN